MVSKFPRAKPKFRLSNIHWRVPTLMICCFIAGVTFSLAHHFFYNHIDKHIVNDASQQQWVTRAGTAAAFIVKLSLATATSAAYTQWLWFQLRAETPKVERLDTMFSVLENAWEFTNLRFWLHHPLLALLAAVTWLLPLSAIVTPGAIVVQPSIITNKQLLTVTQRDFISGMYSTMISDNNTTTFGGASSSTTPADLSSLIQGAIIPVSRQTSDANVSYTLRFEGPAVSCSRADNTTEQYVNHAFEEYENSTQSLVAFAGFTPQLGFGPEMNGSFFSKAGVLSIDNDLNSMYGMLDMFSTDASKFYMRVYLPPANPALISCAFYNASYLVHFDLLSNGQQNVTATTKFLNWFTAKLRIYGLPSDPAVNQTMSYQSIMYQLGLNMQGYQSYPLSNTSQPDFITMTVLEASPQMNYYAFNAVNASGLQTLMSGLESLMQNFTLSGRYGALNPFDITTRAALSNTTANATYSSFVNQYSYKPRDLAIAYGLSIFWAVVCMILGAIAITQNRGSYTNSFSTIVRVTRDPELDRLIEEGEDRIGADPLPDHIAEATVRFGERVGENATKDDMAQQEWPEWI